MMPGCFHSISKTQVTDRIFKMMLLWFIRFPEFTQFPSHLGNTQIGPGYGMKSQLNIEQFYSNWRKTSHPQTRGRHPRRGQRDTCENITFTNFVCRRKKYLQHYSKSQRCHGLPTSTGTIPENLREWGNGLWGSFLLAAECIQRLHE